MGDEEYSLPKGMVDRADARAPLPEHCPSCGHPVDEGIENETEVPSCRVCGAALISDAAGDWLETELQ